LKPVPGFHSFDNKMMVGFHYKAIFLWHLKNKIQPFLSSPQAEALG
jgi:hypothetical protein